jgi:hypothetical protein
MVQHGLIQLVLMPTNPFHINKTSIYPSSPHPPFQLATHHLLLLRLLIIMNYCRHKNLRYLLALVIHRGLPSLLAHPVISFSPPLLLLRAESLNTLGKATDDGNLLLNNTYTYLHYCLVSMYCVSNARTRTRTRTCTRAHTHTWYMCKLTPLARAHTQQQHS